MVAGLSHMGNVGWDATQQQRALVAWTLRTSAAALAAQGFIVYYCLELHANDRLVGLAVALPSLAFAAQFFCSVWAERTASRRRLCVRLFFSHALCWLPVLVVGAWAAGVPDRYGVARTVFVGGLATISVLFHLHSPAWEAWFSDAVPDQQKSIFFGRWGLWSGIGVAGATLVGGWLVEAVARGRTPRIFQAMLLVVFAGGMLGALATAGLYRQLQEVPVPQERPTLRDLVRQALSQRNYMLFLTLYALRMLALMLYAPFVIAWFREDLRMGIMFLSCLTALNQAAVALASPFWSRVVARFGGKPVLAVGLVVAMWQMVIYFFYTPTNYRWLSLVHWGVQGFLLGSYSVAANTLWYRLPLRQARSMQFAIAWTVLGVAGAIGAMAGGWIASHAPPLVMGAHHWSRYHWLMALGIVAHLPCFLLLHQLKEAGASEPRVMASWLLRRVILRRPLG